MHNWEHYGRLPAYFLVATLVASCGGGGGSDLLSLNGQSSVSIVDVPSTVTTGLEKPVPFTITLADNGTPVVGKMVTAKVVSGTAQLVTLSVLTDSLGVATFNIKGNGAASKGTIALTYTDSSNNIATQNVPYEVVDGATTPSNYTIEPISTDDIVIPTSGKSTAIITVVLKDKDGRPVKDKAVTFSLPANIVGVGRLVSASGTTNANGQVSTTIDGLNQTASSNSLIVSHVDAVGSTVTKTIPFRIVNQFDVILTSVSDKLKTGGDSLVLTATVVNASQSLVKDAKVSFQILPNEPVDNPALLTNPCPQDVTDTQQFKPTELSVPARGTLSKNNISTDENGQATTTYAVTNNKNGNRRILVTVDDKALAVKPIACIDLSLSGTILTLEPETFNATAGKSFALTGTVKNGRGVAVKNASVNFVVDSAPQVKTYVTNANGVVVSDPFTVFTTTNIGAQSVDAGVKATDVKVTQVLISDIGIGVDFLNDKKETITEQAIEQTTTLVIKAKDIKGRVNLGTTLGVLENASPALVNGEAIAKMVSKFPGLARIDVRITKEDGSVVTGVGGLRFISTIPKKMTLQSGLSTLNSGEQAEIQAEVLDDRDNPVKGALVSFSSEDPSNGRLSSSLAVTDENGKAGIIFTAGTNDTAKDAVKITSKILAADGTTLVTSIPVRLTVGGQPLFVSIATGKTLQVVNETVYALPMSVVVVDAAGHPVRDQEVSLDVIPTYYLKGIYYFDFGNKVWVTASLNPSAASSVLGTGGDLLTSASAIFNPISCPNEDKNSNGILDVSEDKNGNGILDAGEDVNGNGRLDAAEDLNNDGHLWPGNPVTVQKSVRTDDTGRASFNISYGKSYANWLNMKLIASVKVSGSESKAERDFVLPVLSADITDATVTPPGGTTSPFGVTTYQLIPSVTSGNIFTSAKLIVTGAPAACTLKIDQGGLIP